MAKRSPTPWYLQLSIPGIGRQLHVRDADCMDIAVVIDLEQTAESAEQQLGNALAISNAARMLKHLEKAYRLLITHNMAMDALPVSEVSFAKLASYDAEILDGIRRAISDAGGSTDG